MSKTTAELIQLFKDTLRGVLLSDQDQELGTNAEIVTELNRAQRQLGSMIEYRLPSVSAIFGGGSGYNFTLSDLNANNRVNKIYGMIDASTGQRWEVETQAELNRRYPRWFTDTSEGTPVLLVQTGQRVVVYPVPTSATNYYLDCLCDPLPLSASTLSAESELPEVLHEHIAKFAAALVARTNRLTDVQISTVKNIEAEAMMDCQQAIGDEAVQL